MASNLTKLIKTDQKLFGSWRGFKKPVKVIKDSAPGWTVEGFLDSMKRRNREGRAQHHNKLSK